MANPAHVALFRQGLSEWNHWRTLNASVTPDLSGLTMSAAHLVGADLSHANLRSATLIRSQLVGADLRYADLGEAQLHETDLTDADLFRANLEKAVLAGAKLRRARLFGANLRGSQFTVVDFRKADLREANLERADLRESMGRGASLERASLKGANLTDCILAECNLESASGLESRQIQAAILDESTVLPESFQPLQAVASFDSLARALEAMKARWIAETVPETEVVSYHRLLAKVSSLGVSVEEARVAEAEMVSAVASHLRSGLPDTDETPATTRWVDTALVRGRLEALLDEIRRRAS